jgi:hypothetical protein
VANIWLEGDTMIFWIFIIAAIYTIVLKRAVKLTVKQIVGACFA